MLIYIKTNFLAFAIYLEIGNRSINNIKQKAKKTIGGLGGEGGKTGY